MATPMAKSRGRFPKIALPEAAMTLETTSGSHEKFALPTPSRMPATGNTETGSIMHLPIFCRREKAPLKDGISGAGVGGGWFCVRSRNESADIFRRLGGEGALGQF